MPSVATSRVLRLGTTVAGVRDIEAAAVRSYDARRTVDGIESCAVSGY